MPTPTVWPDTVEALFELLDGTEHAGHQIKLVEEQQGSGPNEREFGMDEVTVVVNLQDSAIGHVDRVDKFRLEIYGHGRKTARDVAESINSMVCVEGGWETDAALVDLVEPKSGPAIAPHPSEQVRRADVSFWITTRPL